MTTHEDHHRIALARELTAAAGFPLRDRYGFAASDETVAEVVRVVFLEGLTDEDAAESIGLAGALGDIELAEDYDTHTSEAYELGIVTALRPLVEQRRAAEAKARER